MVKKSKNKIIIVILVITTVVLGGVLYKSYQEKKSIYVECLEKSNIIKSYKDLQKTLIVTEDEMKNINKYVDNYLENLEDKNLDELVSIYDNAEKYIGNIKTNNLNSLELYYNKLIIDDLDKLTPDEKSKYEKIIGEYKALVKAEEYKKANEKLKEFEEFSLSVEIASKERSKLENRQRLIEEGVDKETIIDGVLIVNKDYPLPSTYNYGEDTEASQAFEAMKNSAASEGVYFSKLSSFRSYSEQEGLFNKYCNLYGEAYAETISARAGFSEHQSGLAFDIRADNDVYTLMQEFEYTPEGIWLKENSYKYGFILRFPKGKEHITEYIFEPWHFRYVGKEIAINFKDNNLSLEEFLGVN